MQNSSRLASGDGDASLGKGVDRLGKGVGEACCVTPAAPELDADPDALREVLMTPF